MRFETTILRTTLALVASMASSGATLAIQPNYVSDVELAAQPAIVVARWKTGLHEGNTKAFAQPSPGERLIVERVIAGDIRPGEYDFKRSDDSFWDAKGKPNGGQTEWYTPIEVTDVSLPNLWFVSVNRGSNINTPDWLSTITGRAIQPMSLERCYTILRGPDRDAKISESLHDTDKLTLLRALRFVYGDQTPWPYDFSIHERVFAYRVTPRAVLNRYLPEVKRLATSQELSVKRLAAATYAACAPTEGNGQVSLFRQLLADPDPEVRLIAVGALAQMRDIDSASHFANAVKGIRDASTACALIDRLTSWGTPVTAPALISFLETDSDGGRLGDYFYVPAIQARKSLQKITGVIFPADVKLGQEAWQKVRSISNRGARQRKLGAILSDYVVSLDASVYNRGGPPRVVLTNRSRREVTLTRLPSDISVSYHWDYGGGMSGSEGLLRDLVSADFIRVHPGRSLTIPLRVDNGFWSRFQFGPVEGHTITLTYTASGNKFGKRAWVGSVPVTFGSGWVRAKDHLVNVNQKWANGQIRATGQTMNGRKMGVWRYYNGGGRLERAEEYLKGGSMATLNLDYLAKHPR